MTTPFWCLLITVLLPYVFAGMTGYFKNKELGHVDNNNPRAQAALLTGAGARANAAQQNAWEAAIVFGLSLMAAELAGADAGKVGMASMVFVAARIGHGICYVADIAPARSLMFFIGMVCCMRLFWLAGAA